MSSTDGVPAAAAARPPVPGPPVRPAGDATDARPAPDDRDLLAGLVDRPLSEHADVFEQVHADLQAALADIDHA